MTTARLSTHPLDPALADLAHELKNSLNTLDLTFQYLERLGHGEIEPTEDAGLGRILEDARGEVGRIRAVADALHDVTRPLEPERAEGDLDRILAEAVAHVRPVAERRRVELARSPSPDPVPVHVDLEHARDALRAAIERSVRETSASDRVEVAATAGEAEGVVRVVRPPSASDRTASTGDVPPGSGSLDVIRSRRLVEAQGGAFDIRVVPGEDTVLRMSFPTPTREEEAEPHDG